MKIQILIKVNKLPIKDVVCKINPENNKQVGVKEHGKIVFFSKFHQENLEISNEEKLFSGELLDKGNFFVFVPEEKQKETPKEEFINNLFDANYGEHLRVFFLNGENKRFRGNNLKEVVRLNNLEIENVDFCQID